MYGIFLKKCFSIQSNKLHARKTSKRKNLSILKRLLPQKCSNSPLKISKPSKIPIKKPWKISQMKSKISLISLITSKKLWKPYNMKKNKKLLKIRRFQNPLPTFPIIFGNIFPQILLWMKCN